MSNFREMLRKGSRKNFRLLKYEHIIYHFKARGDSVDINFFAKYLNFEEILAKTDFTKFSSVYKIAKFRYFAKVITYSKSPDHVLQSYI